MKGMSLSIALVVIFSWHCTSFAQPSKDRPRFKKNQVVVRGDLRDIPGHKVLKYLPHANLTVLEVADKGDEENEIKALRKEGNHAELNYMAYTYASVDDPYYSSDQWHLSRIQSEQAWGLTTGAGVTVAVLDTGLATGGTDGIGCVVAGYDFVNDDNDPFDGNGHGTHVSGTVAQSTDNGIGCAGMAYGACVMPVKVLSDTGSGSFADVADGIHWAVDNGARVINMSLGAHGYTSISYMDAALDYAYNNGVTVVAAAGNDSDTTQVSYPAIYSSVIAVGATNSRDAVASYSNRGTGLDVVAPGSGVVQETLSGSSWGYYSYNGTSMATPHVAAIVAMLIAYDTATTPDEVYTALTETALDLGATGYDSTFGHGLIQAYDALNYGMSSEPVPPVAEISAAPVSGAVPLPVSFSSAGSADSDGTIVSYAWDFGDGGSSAEQNPSYTYIEVGTFTASLTVTDNDGYTDTATLNITVTDPGSGGWTRLLYDDFESGWGNWNDGGRDSGLYSGGSRAHQGTYALNLQDNSSSSVATTDNLSLSGYSQIKVDFWYYPYSMDVSSDGFLLQISTDGGSSYTTVEEWNLGDEFENRRSYSESVVITGFALTDQTRIRFRCDANDNRDDVFIDEIEVSVNDSGSSEPVPPVAEISATPVSGAVPLQVDFSSAGSADSDGTIISYAWNFGDGGSSAEQNPSHTYTEVGTFTASLTVTDNDGYTDTATLNITVTDPGDGGWTRLLYDDFESGWGNWNDGGRDTKLYSGGSRVRQGAYAVNLQDNSSSSVVTTDELALAGYSEIKVDFWYYPYSMDVNSDGFLLQISTDGGSSYTTVEEWNLGDEFENRRFHSDSVVITGFALTDQTRIRFRCDANDNRDDVFIDEIEVSVQ